MIDQHKLIQPLHSLSKSNQKEYLGQAEDLLRDTPDDQLIRLQVLLACINNKLSVDMHRTTQAYQNSVLKMNQQYISNKLSDLNEILRSLQSGANDVLEQLNRAVQSSIGRLTYANLTGRSERDRYLISEEYFHDSGHNSDHYAEWRVNRITKIMTHLGTSYDGMKVLELGGGSCYIGAFMAERGAKVLSLEGRIENVVKAQLRFEHIDSLEIRTFDLEQGFSDLG
jgi:hypothetical protein